MSARRPVPAHPHRTIHLHHTCLALILTASLPACIRDADPGDNAQDAALSGGAGGAMQSGGGGVGGHAPAPDRDVGTPSDELDMSVVEPCPGDLAHCAAEERDRLCYLTECAADPYSVYYRCDGTAWNYDSQDGYDCSDRTDALVPPPDMGTGPVPDAMVIAGCPYDSRSALGPCTAELEGVECWQTDCPRNSPDPAAWSQICHEGQWQEGQSNGNDCFPPEETCEALGAVPGEPCPPEFERYACDRETLCRDGRVEPESVWCRDGLWTAVNNCFDE